jgi:hypothetical protein
MVINNSQDLKYPAYIMKSLLTFLILISISPILKAQDDLPINDEERFSFVPGLYLSFEDFIHNRPVNFDQVEGDLQEFFENPMNSKKLIITRKDSVYHVEQAATWGYNDGKSVYLNRSLFKGMNLNLPSLTIRVNPWVRMHTIGTLSFILYVTTIESRGQYQSVSHTSESNITLNTKDGKFYGATLKELEKLIYDDPELLTEFKKTRDSKDTKFFIFLRKYNERHPIKFP